MQISREDCEILRTRILQLLPVILMAVNNESTKDKGHIIIPPQLDLNIRRFQE